MRTVTQQSIERAALFYLERYSATRAQLIKVLQRKVLRTARLREVSSEAASWVTAVVEKLASLGYIDDARYARNKVSASVSRGQSRRAVAQKLKQRGVASTLVSEALSAHDDERAAWAYARRRKLGPFAVPAVRREKREKHLAALLRRGFAFGLAKKIIDAPADAVVDVGQFEHDAPER